VSALVTVRIATDPAFKAFMDVVQADGVQAHELGINSGIYMVVFSGSDVEIGTGFDTLRGMMAAHTAESVAGLERAPFG
jgi:hypothetical protein